MKRNTECAIYPMVISQPLMTPILYVLIALRCRGSLCRVARWRGFLGRRGDTTIKGPRYSCCKMRLNAKGLNADCWVVNTKVGESGRSLIECRGGQTITKPSSLPEGRQPYNIASPAHYDDPSFPLHQLQLPSQATSQTLFLIAISNPGSSSNNSGHSCRKELRWASVGERVNQGCANL